MGKRCLYLSQVEVLESRRLMANILGLDAASYQYDMNWVTAKADGYVFGWEKATQGIGYTNPYFSANVSAAKAAGVPIGAYCFANFADSAVGVADYYWGVVSSSIKNDGLSLVPMLDAEQGENESGNEDAWVTAWSNEVIAKAAAAGLTVNPIIYTDTSFAATYFSTTTSKAYPLWIASSGSPTNSTTAPWTSYEIWQYGETSSIPTTDGEGNVNADADQLNGDSTELRNLIVGEGKFAINSSVETNASTTVYQNSSRTGTTSTVTNGSIGTVLSLPVYYNNAWMFDVKFSATVSGWVTETSLAVPTAPSVPTTTAPANNATITTIPTFTWNADAGATSYDLYVNNSIFQSGLTTTSYTPSTFAAGSYTWYVKARNTVGTTNSATASFSYVLPIPTASYVSQGPSTGSNVLDFSVGYYDPAAPINISTFDSYDITVTGPNGYSQAATFTSPSQPGNGQSRSANYEITAPGDGVWDALSNGTYTVTLNANQVADTNGTYVAAGTLGTFVVNAPFAYINTSGQLVMNATSAYPDISFAKSGSLWNVSNGNTSIQFNPLGYTSVDFVGTAGDDSLTISSAMTVPLSFNGGTGNDLLTVTAGSLSFASDLGATTATLTLTLSSTAQVTFSSDEHLAELDLYGHSAVILAAGAGIALDMQALSINSSAYLDVADNALVLYGSDSDTVSSYLTTGYNNGAWNGPGIRSSSAATTLGYTVGFAPASSVSYSNVNGVSFSTQAIVVRYTPVGDANLDGTINADDLSLMMLAAVQQQQAASNNQTPPAVYWYNGDFNYNSTVDSDDFMLLSLGSAVQNQQMLG